MNLQTNQLIGETSPTQLAACVAAAPCVPLITGQEPLPELRRLIIEFSQGCLASTCQSSCPFHIMGTLSHRWLTTLVNSLPREACLDLFKLEQKYRSQFEFTGLPQRLPA